MDDELFIQTRRHTIAVEQTHWKSTSLVDMLADVLTKPLPLPALAHCIQEYLV
jgi:hypothetical protein